MKGHADRLIQTHSPAYMLKANSGGEMPEVNSVGSSNESLASVGRESLDLLQLSALAQPADIDDICDEEIQNVLDSESDDGEYAAGEAMAEFSEDANMEVEMAASNGFQRNVDTDHSKPPNILIYCGKKDSSRKFEGVRQIFAQCLHPERYVIYHLKHDQVLTTPWKDNSALLILSSEKLYDGVDEAVYSYFRNGGKVLSFCSSLDNYIIKRYPYQDSPMNVLLLNCGSRINVTVIGGRFGYTDIKNDLMRPNDIKNIDVLGIASEFGDKPVIIKVEAKQKDSEKSGVAILSQVCWIWRRHYFCPLTEDDFVEVVFNDFLIAVLVLDLFNVFMCSDGFVSLTYLIGPCYLSIITQKPLTSAVVLSSDPAHDGFLSGRMWEDLPTMCG